MSGQAFFFLAGAVAGTLLDRIHVASGVLSYARPLLWGQALWVPLVFGVGGLAMVNGQRLFAPRAPASEPARSLVLPAAGLVAAYVATALANETPWLLAGALAGAWLARLAIHPSLERVSAALALAVAGPLVEAALSAMGGFSYRRPDLLGVPIWLPALYLHVSPLTRQIDRVFR